jgi:hypothetical protein
MEFSSSDPVSNFLDTYGQFNVAQWIKSSIKIREALCFMITAPCPFARNNPLRFLTLWSVEGCFERSQG